MRDNSKKTILAGGIRDIIESCGLTQREAARKMGIPQPKLSKLLNGTFESISEMKLMECLSRLGSDVKITISGPNESPGRTIIEFREKPVSQAREISPLKIVANGRDVDNWPKIPLFMSPASCGFPSPADDYVEAHINLHELMVRNPEATFFLKAAGDSMLGVGIHDGDLLLVDRSLDAVNGRTVIAAIDGELLVKKLARRNGKVFLAPANPDYPEIDITFHEYVHIWGVVTWVLHEL